MLLLHADGACQPNPGEGSYGVVVYEDGAQTPTRTVRTRIGHATNNIAEWRAAIKALEIALEPQFIRHGNVELRMDSRMVVEQLNGRWRVKDAKLKPLAAESLPLLNQLRQRVKLTIKWVPREQNECADIAAGSV